MASMLLTSLCLAPASLRARGGPASRGHTLASHVLSRQVHRALFLCQLLALALALRLAGRTLQGRHRL